MEGDHTGKSNPLDDLPRDALRILIREWYELGGKGICFEEKMHSKYCVSSPFQSIFHSY
jgi:hypothetical protein